MPKIAIVAPDLSILNGVTVVAKFLYDIINSSENFSAELISIATSARDVCSVRLVSPQTWLRGVNVDQKEFQGIPFRHVGANFTEIEYFRYQPRKNLNQILKDFDLVQVVAGAPAWALAARDFSGILALQVATLSKIERETLIAQTAQPKRSWIKAMSAINARLETQAFERADAIFVENDWLKNLLEKKYSEKVVFAPPGVDTDFFVPARAAKGGYILSVGRFGDRRKNVRLLFEAYKMLTDKFGKAEIPKLVLAGQTAPSDTDLAVAENLKIRDKIEIYTAVSVENLRDFYQNAAVFVLSSNEEGFGLVIAEAMACGLPVVSTKCGGPEVLVIENVTGFLTPIGDTAELAEKTSLVLRNPQTADSFGKAARKRAIEMFSYLATGRIYLKTYEKLLKI